MKRFIFDLQRFAEAGDTSQAAAETGESTGQAAAVDTETKASFEDLIKGEYKQDYEKNVQRIIRQRFAKAKADEAKLGKLEPVVQALASKYNVGVDDLDSIAKFVGEDDSLYEEAAYRAGMSVDQYKKYSLIEAENHRLLAEKQANEERKAAQERFDQLLAESESIKAEFPNFDLVTMLNDDRFAALLRSGIGMRNAYIALDADNILPGVMNYTAQQVAKKTASTIAQRGNRPAEGGMSGQASAKANTDVSKLSNAEMIDLIRRAGNGERITFSG